MRARLPPRHGPLRAAAQQPERTERNRPALLPPNSILTSAWMGQDRERLEMSVVWNPDGREAYRRMSYGSIGVPSHQCLSAVRRNTAKWRWGVSFGALPEVPT